jgi:hypothetical protein
VRWQLAAVSRLLGAWATLVNSRQQQADGCQLQAQFLLQSTLESPP